MSAVRMVALICDGPDCLQGPDSGAEHTADATRHAARTLDWHTGLPGGRDLCPECWEAGHR